MPLSVSRRTLAALTVAALLALASPGLAHALPPGHPGESRSFVQQFLDGAAGWVRAFLSPFWQADGNGFDPHGTPTPTANGDEGSGLDPHGAPSSAGDDGNGLDPHGSPRPTANGDAGWGLDPEGAS